MRGWVGIKREKYKRKENMESLSSNVWQATPGTYRQLINQSINKHIYRESQIA